jgi:hypothetical protein
MDAQLIGQVDKPACVVVSSWDPLLPATREFLRQLVEYAHAHEQSPVVVVLDPAPQTYLRGAANWPVYMSFLARGHWLRAQGLEGMVRLDFQEDDLKLGVYDVLDAVRAEIRIAEVWMRPQQTFGPDSRGSALALAMYAKKHNLAWKRPATPETKVLANTVHHHLRRGEVAAAQAIVGLPPMWSRPEAEHLGVAWQPGRYLAMPVTLDSSVTCADPIVVELQGQASGLARLHWPAREIDHLSVLFGPGDSTWQAESVSREWQRWAAAV